MPSHKQHLYPIRMTWTGNTGTGTADYRGYQRAHEYSVPGKPPIPGSSDPAFRGDAARYNPEELLVMALSSCHMLWYLHLCAEAGLVVTSYVDQATGTMVETPATGGHFTDVVLRPSVTLKPGSDVAAAESMHDRAHHLCFRRQLGQFSCSLRTTHMFAILIAALAVAQGLQAVSNTAGDAC